MKSGNSSIYKKCGTLFFSLPGLLKTEFCINNIKNSPNALCVAAPKSPLRVHTNVTSPFSRASSKLMLSLRLQRMFLTPSILSRLSNCVTAEYTNFSVSALPEPLL